MEIREDGSTLETRTVENKEGKPLAFAINAFINSEGRLEINCDNVTPKLLEASINGLIEIRKDMLAKNPMMNVEALGKQPVLGQGLSVVNNEDN